MKKVNAQGHENALKAEGLEVKGFPANQISSFILLKHS